MNGLGRLRRILLALQHLDEVVGRPQGVARQQRALVVHGHGDLPDAGGLLEGSGPADASIRDSVAVHGVLMIELDRFGGVDRLLLRFIVRWYHRQLGSR